MLVRLNPNNLNYLNSLGSVRLIYVCIVVSLLYFVHNILRHKVIVYFSRVYLFRAPKKLTEHRAPNCV